MVPSEAPKGDLLARARAGDTSAMATVRRFLDDPEASQQTVDIYGNASKHAVRALARAWAAGDLLTAECLERKAGWLAAELAGPGPSPIERLLAERAAITWLHANMLEARVAGAGDATPGHVEGLTKRLDRGHKRFVSALVALAKVRKLALPSVQINLANQQVNVSEGRSGSGRVV